MPIQAPDFTHVEPARLARAVLSLIESQPKAERTSRISLPGLDELRAGAEATHRDGDLPQARAFQSMLELCYLVASADGFAEEERQALAALLEHATGRGANRDELELHFHDLDDACAALGRKERLRRAAADFDDELGRGEAVGFAALVAVADGRLVDDEFAALVDLAACFDISRDEVEQAVQDLAQNIQRALAG